MSLQVWLPLNGNTSNQGLNGLSMTGSPGSWGNGKIGKCATFNGNLIHTDTTELNYTDNFSYCLWINQNYSGAVAEFAFTVGRADSGGYGYGIQIHSASLIGLWFGSRRIDISCPANEWHHIAFTVSGTIIKVYKDGALLTTSTTQTLPTYSDGKGFGLGYFHYSAGDIYPYHGSLNDFRIYDHCLSAKEVKEISKGLICHYKLSNPYETGRSNKYGGTVASGAMPFKSGSFTMTALENERGYNYKFTYTGTGESSWPSMSAENYSFTAGKRYYYSCKVRCHSANFSMQLRASRSNNDWVTNMTNVISSSLADGKWHEYVVSQVVNSTYDRVGETITCNPVLEFYTEDLSTSGKVYSADFDMKDVQVIESDWYMPFIDGSMSTTVVSDCSGLGNNGIAVGSITYKNSSVRYDGCYAFTGDDYIKIPKPLTISNSSYFTIAMWVKPESGCGSYSTILSNFNSPDSGFWMAINTEDSGTWFYNGTYAKGNSLLTVGQWSHIAMVFNAGTITWYTNGVATSTSNVSSRATAFTDYIAIGNSYAGTTWNTDFVGSISDVRIYSSVLSAEDIKALYNIPASVDKNGTMYAYEFMEE